MPFTNLQKLMLSRGKTKTVSLHRIKMSILTLFYLNLQPPKTTNPNEGRGGEV